VWSFKETQPASGAANVSIAFSPSMPSSLILPVVPGVNVPSGLPPCPSLRNEPCRPYTLDVATLGPGTLHWDAATGKWTRESG
jgi:hypothetical protein